MSSIRTSILTLLLGSFFVAVLLFTGDKSSRSNKSLRDKSLDDLIYSPSSDDSTSASSVVTKNIQSVNNNNNNNNNIPTAFSTQIASTKQIIINKEQKSENDDQQDEESQQQQPTFAQASTPPPSPVIKINTKQESAGSASSNSETFSSPTIPKFNNSYIPFSSFPSDAYAVGPDHKYPQLDGGSMKRLDDSTKQKLAQLPRARFGWKQRLNTPTWVGYQLGYWWIIDCWHHRVLYRKRKEDEGDDDLDAERDFEKGWKSLKVANASWMVIPHSLVTDGKSVIMIESSINGSGNGLEHSVLVFEKITDLDHPLRKFGKKLKNNEINKEEYQIKRQKNLHFDKWKKQKLERNKEVESPPPPALKSNILKTNSDDQSVVGSPPSVSSDQQQQPEIPNENTTFYDEFGDNYDIASALSVYDDDDDFILVQRVLACIPSRPDIRRPHRLVFDSEINSFFLWLTSPGALSRFNRLLPAKDDPHSEQQRQLDQKYLENFGKVRPRVSFAFCKVIPFMAAGGYARTIALTPTRYGPQLLISLGPNLIHRIAHRFIDRNTDPESIQSSGSFYHTQWRVQRGSMNDVFFHDGYWYITQTNKCAIHRQRQLTPSKLMGKVKIHGKEIRGNVNRKGLTANMKPDMLKKNFPLCRSSRIGNSDMCQGGGVPYFMSTVGKRIYMTYIFGCSGIVSFVPTVDLDGGNGTGTNIGYMPGYVGDVRHHFEKAGWIETLDDLIARGLVW